jgi:hypothetical protein
MSSAYERLLSVLDTGGATYRIIEYEPEGRTEVVSRLRQPDRAGREVHRRDGQAGQEGEPVLPRRGGR